MATQLGARPSRVERVRIEEDKTNNEHPRVNRVLSKIGNDKNAINQIKNVGGFIKNISNKPINLNFICMLLVSGTLDIIGFFTSEFPGVGVVLSIIYNIIFIPWFYFSGIKFNLKKISSMGTTSLLEYIPIIGNLPFMTVNVIYSYYSN